MIPCRTVLVPWSVVILQSSQNRGLIGVRFPKVCGLSSTGFSRRPSLLSWDPRLGYDFENIGRDFETFVLDLETRGLDFETCWLDFETCGRASRNQAQVKRKSRRQAQAKRKSSASQEHKRKSSASQEDKCESSASQAQASLKVKRKSSASQAQVKPGATRIRFAVRPAAPRPSIYTVNLQSTRTSDRL